MRKAGYLSVFCILLLTFAVAASAQKNRKPVPKATPKPTPVTADVTAAKQQVANQLYNVNVFVDKMGPIAVMIEGIDKDAADGKLKKEAVDANQANKTKMVAAIRGLRDGLLALESDFRTKPSLAAYLPKIQGIGTLCAQSEDHAIAGQFVASKDPLRQVAAKLNDTLLVMPGAAIGGTTAPLPVPNRTIPASAQKTTTTAPVQSTTTTRPEPSIGMTADEALQSSWGAPASKRTSISTSGNTEVWTYSGNRALYFFKGKLTNIVR